MKTTFNPGLSSNSSMPAVVPTEKMALPSFFSKLSSYVPSLSGRNILIAGAGVLIFLFLRSFWGSKSDGSSPSSSGTTTPTSKPSSLPAGKEEGSNEDYAEKSFEDLLNMHIRLQWERRVPPSLAQEITSRFAEMTKEDMIFEIATRETALQMVKQKQAVPLVIEATNNIVIMLQERLIEELSWWKSDVSLVQDLTNPEKITSWDIAYAIITIDNSHDPLVFTSERSSLMNELKKRVQGHAELAFTYGDEISTWSESQQEFTSNSVSYTNIQKTIQAYELLVEVVKS